MRKLKIYFDTSIISFIYADDSPEKRNITCEFLDKYMNRYEVFISRFVIAEIENTTNSILKEKLLDAVSAYPINIIEIPKHEETQIFELANEYINKGIIPKQKFDDAVHIAICTVNEFDILLSWNFRHISNIKKQIQINNINKEQGYLKELYLLNPMEVIIDDE
ncbi:MAG: PIN domain-containing protein [Spirochaetales bacterium]|nr:PIN domain-containing protein [Spirochaetales bacterium]